MRLNERKIVKTISLKKVSAVAVASLGFGLLSVVPAQAAIGTATAISVANTTTVGGTALTTTTSTANAVIDELQVSAFTAKAGSAIIIQLTATGGTGFTAENSTRVKLRDYGFVVASHTNAITATGAEDPLPSFNAPALPGTYFLDIETTTNAGMTYEAGTTLAATVTLTVTALAGYSAPLSTAVIGANAEGANAVPDSTSDKIALSAAQAVGTKAGTILVTLKDTANALYAGQTVTASITGSGFVTVGSSAGVTGANIDTADGTASTTRTANAVSSTGYAAIGIWGDGTSGTGTVTVSITDKVSLATTVLATKTVSWYGSIKTLEATVLQGIARPGVANGDNSQNAATQATLALTPAVVVVAKDANGVVVPGATVTGKPADVTIVASSATAGPVNGTTDKNGPGYYNFDVTGGSSANVGKSTTIVYSTVVSGVTISSAPVTIALAGTAATVTMTLDKTSYTPGAPVVITVTAKDSAGNAAADGTYANLFAGASTLGGAITGSTPGASVEIKGGVKTFTAFAPGTGGTYVVSNKFGTSMPAAQQGATISASIVVSDPNAGLLTQIDALNAKIVALNALIAKIMKKLGVK